MVINLIPMAGLGSRFTNEGYILPKPLIPVSGVPMIHKVIDGMPKADKWIFVVRQEHIDKYAIDQVIKKKLPQAIILPMNYTTEGQACTCMLAKDYLNKNEPLLIGACDNSSLYDEDKYKKFKESSCDAIIWTFTKEKRLTENPHSYGWCILDKKSITIKDISVKKPISEYPYNDHAVVATFYFKKAQDFIDATELMIKENYRINNEFYVDSLPIFLARLNKNSVIFDVDLIICWGTPKELYLFQEIEYYFTNKDFIDITKIDKHNLWLKYFNK